MLSLAFRDVSQGYVERTKHYLHAYTAPIFYTVQYKNDLKKNLRAIIIELYDQVLLVLNYVYYGRTQGPKQDKGPIVFRALNTCTKKQALAPKTCNLNR